MSLLRTEPTADRAPRAPAVALAGLFSVMVTPFDDAGAVDEPSLDRLVDFLIAGGVHGLTTLAVMGETARLTPAERERVAARVLAHTAGRVPVVVGVDGNDEASARALSRHAGALGAAAVLVIPPTGRDLAGVIACCRDLASVSPLPQVLLDHPPTTGLRLPVAALVALADAVEAVAAVKLEDAPTPAKIAALRTEIDDRLRIFGGLGGVACLPELENGADGMMTGYAYPEHLVAIYARCRLGDATGAARIFRDRRPVMLREAESGAGIAVRKEILRRRGAIAGAAVRPPTPAIDTAARAALHAFLDSAGL